MRAGIFWFGVAAASYFRFRQSLAASAGSRIAGETLLFQPMFAESLQLPVTMRPNKVHNF